MIQILFLLSLTGLYVATKSSRQKNATISDLQEKINGNVTVDKNKTSPCFLKNISQPGYSFDVTVQKPSPRQCQLLCQRSPGCNAFTWTRKNRNCNLKSSWYGAKREHSEKVTGPAFCSEASCFKEDTAIVKYQLGHWWVRHTKETPEECQGLCQGTQGCKGFTWNRETLRCTLYRAWDMPELGLIVTEAREGEVSGPAHCNTAVGGTCPPPGCVKYWVYNGEKQKGCGDPGLHGGQWCPLPPGLNSTGHWVTGSPAWTSCRAPTQCLKSWKYLGVNQSYCSSVGSPGRPWCPLKGGVKPDTNEYFRGGKFSYCTEDLCLDPGSCTPDPACPREWKYGHKKQVHCSDVNSPGKPWCPDQSAVDKNGKYRNGGRKMWCKRETCDRTPCGQNAKEYKQEGSNRVVGGKPADPDEWPWLAALVVPGDKGAFCGASLISDTYLVTAAHCLQYHTKDKFRVKLGEYDFTTDGETGDKIFEVDSIKIHEDWNTDTYENDIALLRLKIPTTFSKSIWPICLPPAETDFTNKTATVIGWGTIRFGGPTSSRLLEAQLKVWDPQPCRDNYLEILGRSLASSMICANHPKRDACQGDSGGPLNCLNPATGRWELCGIVSWGARCAEPDLPGVYTKVTDFLPWVRRNMVREERGLVFF